MSLNTKVKITEFKKSPIFNIMEVDDEGKEKSEFALIGMGIKKVEAILNHVEELKVFLAENKKG